MTKLKPYIPYIIGGVAMILGAAGLAILLTGHGGTVQVADKKPAQQHARAAGQGKALDHMELQAQYAGPLQDTVIQRWRDPDNGMICYVYLPILVHHSPPTSMGLVQYGANGIGSISCLPGK